jgi:hypothetical protein
LALRDTGLVEAWGWLESFGQVAVPEGLDGVVEIGAGGFRGLAIRQETGYPAISSATRVLARPGDPATHQVQLDPGAGQPVRVSAIGLPPGLTIETDTTTGAVSISGTKADDFRTADPDRDGTPILLDHTFNLDPKLANPTLLPKRCWSLRSIPNGNGASSRTRRRPPGRPAASHG